MDRMTVKSVRRIMIAGLTVAAGAAVLFAAVSGCAFLNDTVTDEACETISAAAADPELVIPGGRSVGVKLDVEDVLVVGVEEIET